MKEFKKLLKDVNFDLEKLADLTGKSLKTINKWISENKVPKIVKEYLKLLKEKTISKQDINKEFEFSDSKLILIYNFLIMNALENRLVSINDILTYLGKLKINLNELDHIKKRQIIQNYIKKIMKIDFNNDLPFLSAIVVNDNSNRPGDWFFDEAFNLGILESKTESAKSNFWVNEFTRTFRYYNNLKISFN